MPEFMPLLIWVCIFAIPYAIAMVGLILAVIAVSMSELIAFVKSAIFNY